MENRSLSHISASVRADDLRYLLTVVRTGTFAMAASLLEVDKSTVSRRIQALERTLGVRLLQQGSDGWELTTTGARIAELARPIEAALEEVVDAARPDAATSLRGTVRVSCPEGFGRAFVVPAVVEVSKAHPELNIELISSTRDLTLHQAGFDLAISVGWPASTKFVTELLASYTLSLYSTEEYLAQRGTPRSVEELSNHVLIYYTDSLIQVGALDIEQILPSMTSSLSSTSISAQLEATRLGAGIGILPKFLAQEHSLTKVDIPGTETHMEFVLVARRENARRREVNAIRDALHRQIEMRRGELSD